MSGADDMSDEIMDAQAVERSLSPQKNPLNDERLMRKLKPRAWLIMQLGKAKLNDDDERIARIFELLDIIARKRGRPPTEKPNPKLSGRPQKWTKQHREDWLGWLDDLKDSDEYKRWLKINSKHDFEKSRILYSLEYFIAFQNLGKKERNVKSEARSRLRSYQNEISKARQLSRKPSE